MRISDAAPRRRLLDPSRLAIHRLCLLATLAACAPKSGPGQAPRPNVPGSSDAAAFEVLFASSTPELSTQPNLFEISIVTTPGATPLRRGGDLPAPNQVLKLDGLPAADAATITAGLYKVKIDPATKTHTCTGDAPVHLVAGETATASLSCIAISNADGLSPVKVFVKVAKASLTLTETSADAILAARDWAAPSLFSFNDTQGRRITVKQDAAGLTVHVGGDLSYFVATGPRDAGQKTPLQRLVAGDTLALDAIGGHLLTTAPQPGHLALTESPLLFEEDNGDLRAVLAIDLANQTGTIDAAGRLLEEPADAEFTVASYNVENLFDQTDEARNDTYGDYRITPNAQGQSSNWGVPVEFEGHTVSFTDVKVAGVRKALLGVDPAGPAVVGLVEIESKASLDKVFDAVRDLGYVSSQFTEWSGDIAPAAIGAGLISKFPITAWSLVAVHFPAPAPGAPANEPARPILRATLDIHGRPLVVYVNHWKSKGGPESMRVACAQAVEADVEALLATNPKADYILLGDFNSDYNESVTIEPANNDTDHVTGINHVLRAQGDELAVLKGLDATLKYNLHYELDRSARATAWYAGHGWGTIDNIIIGAGLYDKRGVTYVDNSFQVATAAMPRLSFLFGADGLPNRWHEIRVTNKVTRHEIGGFSDHLPIFARFRLPVLQSAGTIPLLNPGKPDAADPRI